MESAPTVLLMKVFINSVPAKPFSPFFGTFFIYLSATKPVIPLVDMRSSDTYHSALPVGLLI